MLGKFMLWLSASTFIAYGLACLFSPTLPAGYAGLALVTGDAVPEIGAMSYEYTTAILAAIALRQLP